MDISVVIPTYNSGAMLTACLLSLQHQILPEPASYEVIVVDDGSTDGTGEMIRRLRPSGYDLVHHFVPRTAQSNRGAARNQGLALARGELVVMIDADQVVPPGFLAQHLRFHAGRPDVVVIGPRMVLAEGPIDLDRLADGFRPEALPPVAAGDPREGIWRRLSENINQVATTWHHLYTCNVSVRREHVLAAGGFDEGFRGWGLEDSELGYRLSRKGLSFAYNREAVLYHAAPRDSGGDRFGEWKSNLRYFIAKHDELPVIIQRLLQRSFDPHGSDLDWVEGCVRFEFAVRALAGRLPSPAPFRIVEIAAGNEPAVRAALPELAAAGNLLVLDDGDTEDFALLVQSIETPFELRYFRRPDKELRDELLQTYGRAG